MNRALALAAAAGSLFGCQNDDLERVTPQTVSVDSERTIITATRPKKNVMFLVDESASMNTRIDVADPTSPTRLDEVKAAGVIALRNPRALSRFGLAAFPTGGQSCGTSSTLKIDLPAPATLDDDAALTAHAEQVIAALEALVPQGGTPTGLALEQLALNAGLTDANDFRDDVVVLITDGLPNCNAANPNNLCSCASSCSTQAINACACTGASCTQTTCALGCLDDQGAIAAIEQLRSLNVRTAVLGFGSELSDASATGVLTAMARAGGSERMCGEVPCDRPFYAANNRDELSDALVNIIGPQDCRFQLSSTPSDPALLEVVVNGVVTASGPDTWSYGGGANQVTLTGALCDTLRRSTALQPFDFEVRVAERY